MVSPYDEDENETQRHLWRKVIELEKNPPTSKKNFEDYSIRINPKAYLMPFIDSLTELIKEKFSSNEVYFSRSDQIGPLSKFIYPSKNYNKIINSLKDVLSKEDIGALLVASRICEREDGGRGEDKEEKDRLKKAYHMRGITLYNWLRSGEVFREDIIPLLSTKESFDSVEDFKHSFKDIFENFLDFHPRRIFISMYMTVEDLQSEIERRSCYYNSNKIVIYSRSGRNNIAREVIKDKEIEIIGKKFEVHREDYKLGNASAIKFTLIHKEEKDFDQKKILIRKLRPISHRERKKLFDKKRREFQLEEEKNRMKRILSLFGHKN